MQISGHRLKNGCVPGTMKTIPGTLISAASVCTFVILRLPVHRLPMDHLYRLLISATTSPAGLSSCTRSSGNPVFLNRLKNMSVNACLMVV